MLKRGTKLVPKLDYVLTFGYRYSYNSYSKALTRAIEIGDFDFVDEIIRMECPIWFLLRNHKNCLDGGITCKGCWNTKCSCSPLEAEIIEVLSIRDWTMADYAELGITTAQDMIEYIEDIYKKREAAKNE